MKVYTMTPEEEQMWFSSDSAISDFGQGKVIRSVKRKASNDGTMYEIITPGGQVVCHVVPKNDETVPVTTFVPLKKRTDNPCTCGWGPHLTRGHHPDCLSLYPKQPAPGDVVKPEPDRQRMTEGRWTELCHQYERSRLNLREQGEVINDLGRARRSEEAKDATIKAMADALEATANASVDGIPCWCGAGVLTSSSQHYRHCQNRRKMLRLAGRIPKEESGT